MRKTWIDIAKGIGIILVCLGHSRLVENDYSASWIYSFHMPFFFMIAGYCLNLGRYGTYARYLVQKLKVLAYPCLMLSIAGAIMGILIVVDNWNIHCVIKQLIRSVYPYPGYYMIGFWFIHVLFFVEIIFAAFKGRAIHGFALFCVIASLYPFSERVAFQVPAFFRALVFYYLGYMLQLYLRRKPFAVKSVLVKGVALVVVLGIHLAILWVSGFPIYHCGDLPLQRPLVYFAVAILGSLGLVCVANIVERLRIFGKTLAWIGRYSILLLAVHPICGIARASWCRSFNWMSGGWSVIIELMFIALFMWLLSGPLNFFMRIPNRWRKEK